MSQEPRDAPTHEPANGVSEGEVVAHADDRIEDIEDEFGPNPPRRGSTPGNPGAEEKPSKPQVI